MINVLDWVNLELIPYIEDLGYVRETDEAEDYTVEQIVKFRFNGKSDKRVESLWVIFSDDYVSIFVNDALYHDYDDKVHYLADYLTFEEFKKAVFAEVDRKVVYSSSDEDDDTKGNLHEDEVAYTSPEEVVADIFISPEPEIGSNPNQNSHPTPEPSLDIRQVSLNVERIMKVLELLGVPINSKQELPLGMVLLSVNTPQSESLLFVSNLHVFAYDGVLYPEVWDAKDCYWTIDKWLITHFLYRGYSFLKESDIKYEEGLKILTKNGIKKIKDENTFNIIKESILDKINRVLFCK